MSNWNTNQGKITLINELKSIEATFVTANLKWGKIKPQNEDSLAVITHAIKSQVRRGFIALKEGYSKEDKLYKSEMSCQ